MACIVNIMALGSKFIQLLDLLGGKKIFYRFGLCFNDLSTYAHYYSTHNQQIFFSIPSSVVCWFSFLGCSCGGSGNSWEVILARFFCLSSSTTIKSSGLYCRLIRATIITILCLYISMNHFWHFEDVWMERKTECKVFITLLLFFFPNNLLIQIERNKYYSVQISVFFQIYQHDKHLKSLASYA